MLLALAGAFPAAVGRADVDLSEYQVSRAVSQESERQKLREEFARQRQEEAQREQARADSETRQREAQAALLAARPWPVRLTESKCTACHADNRHLQVGHTWPGWLLVILRMRLFNDAPITAGDMVTISRHLAEASPASPTTAIAEWAGLGLLVLGIVRGGAYLKRRYP